MIVRQFNAEGIAAFNAFLTECRANPQLPVRKELLKDNSLTERITPQIGVEPQHFTLRRDAAEYLTTLLEALPADEVAENAGLWSWLSLYYFDEVCPARDGRRRVRSSAFYVYEPKHARRAYYHLLFIPWRIARMAPSHGRLFLAGPVHEQSEATRLVMKRLYLLRIPCIFEVLDRLYWDDGTQRPRRGIVSKEKAVPGDLRNRFHLRIRQLEKTYDLLSLNADQLVELLGEEFQVAEKSAVNG